MAEHVDKEVEAIGVVLRALEPLPQSVRSSVIEYVVKRLGVAMVGSSATNLLSDLSPHTEPSRATAVPVHIRELKEEKQPRSANEMAALVAYYLSEVVSPDARKKTINTEDVIQQFKIAKFSLPRHPQMTLPNAKNAGYFDLAGHGEYRLNPVGYNLVEHGMPRGNAATPAGAVKQRKRRIKKK